MMGCAHQNLAMMYESGITNRLQSYYKARANCADYGIGWLVMAMNSGFYASRLRHELGLRNREYARGRLHVESYGGQPVIVYAPEGERHGNFFDASYAAIAARPEWMRRFNKIHAQGRALPKPTSDPARRWRELDSSMSSDALLMNVFCARG